MRFSDKLILSQWLIEQLGVEKFESLSDWLKAPEFEGWNDEGHSLVVEQLIVRLPAEENRSIGNAQLREYDLNILKHWQHITQKRNLASGHTLYPLYFQYLALLFTEAYLDQYFRDEKVLRKELNEKVESWNENVGAADKAECYKTSDLNKLAFWMATGSGKTLIMHCQIRQYLHYLGKAGKRSDLNRIILLTPNEGLSRQHQLELEESRIESAIFEKDGPDLETLFTGRGVDIIDIHKLREKSGDKTVAVDAFEGNNLVLVDEGHRGSGGDDWMEKRARLCESGFSFEYSATFGQAIKAAAGTTNPPKTGKAPSKKYSLTQTYGKCIAFDYSYKYFYGDGYGKDFSILNLKEENEEETRPLYLTACLLSFYQQCLRFSEGRSELKPYGLANPLLIFVGRSVLASSSGSAFTKEGKKTASDMIEVLRFLGNFIGNQSVSVSRLELLLTKRSDLVAGGKRIFDSFFPFVGDKYAPSKAGAQELFRDILKVLFNAPGGGSLHVVHMQGSDGEIGLRIGTNEYFGVVNVGEAKKLCDLVEEHSEPEDHINVEHQSLSHSLFANINRPDSEIRFLMGSKKFTEGWSSWRVSTMGFMNIGKKEGSEIIQLFGRGVRLKGYKFTLKRSLALDSLFYRNSEGEVLKHPKHIELLETLNIFGVRSDYMKEFEEYLEEEGLGEEERPEVIVLPTIKNLARKDLKIIRKSPDATEFKKEQKIRLASLEGKLGNKVVADWYPRLESKQTGKAQGGTATLAVPHKAILREQHLAFIDWDVVYFSLEEFKRQRALYNILFTPEELKSIAHETWWYELSIPENQMEFANFERTRLWQEIVTGLLKGYLERFYHHHKANHDSPFMEVKTLEPNDPNFFTEYRALVKKSEATLIRELGKLREKLSSGECATLQLGQLDVFGFGRHLYHPLISINKDRGDEQLIKVSPVHLNEGEKQFVKDLKGYCESTAGKKLTETYDLYLLRNQSKGTGIGFFEDAGFYPDFLLWLIDGDGFQHVTFIDPKGLGRLSGNFNNPKVKFPERLAELQRTQLKDDKLKLNSFLISNTHQHDLRWPSPSAPSQQASYQDYKDNHILFQKDNPEKYPSELVESILG